MHVAACAQADLKGRVGGQQASNMKQQGVDLMTSIAFVTVTSLSTTIMSTNDPTPDVFTKNGLAASAPLTLKGTAHHDSSEALELDGVGDNAHRHGQYYLQLAFFTCLAVGCIVSSTLPYDLDHTNNIFAALAKVVLMALVAYLPGRGPLKLRRELSDICQWVCFITSVAITIIIGDTSALGSHWGLFGIVHGLVLDCFTCGFAVTWKSSSRTRQIVYLPHRLIAALLQRPVASQGEDYA
ncbi:hypothetical protein C8F01DRAFT_172102 [Mycena amicta]|nr:hypothetical protein C8F01DRAFT_172102 [Mycena amicta]